MRLKRLYSYTTFVSWLTWVIFLILVPPDLLAARVIFFVTLSVAIFSSCLYILTRLKLSLVITAYLVGLVFFMYLHQLNWPTLVIFTILIISLSLLDTT